jgi:hypothetical protein
MCYAIENWSLFIRLVVVLKPIKFDEVCSGIAVGTIAGVVTNFSTLKAYDVGRIILVGLGHIGSVVVVIVASGLEISPLPSPRESLSMVGSSGSV